MNVLHDAGILKETEGGKNISVFSANLHMTHMNLSRSSAYRAITKLTNTEFGFQALNEK